MSQTLEDIKPYLDKRRLEAKDKYTGQLRRIQVEAERMSELSADPKWELYGRYVEKKKRESDDALASIRASLTGATFLDGKEYGQLKMEERYMEGYRDAVVYALGIAKEIIDRGHAAEAELTNIIDNKVESA